MNKLFKKVAIIAGARPNFMKVAPLCRVLQQEDVPYILINTGQHFSADMSENFFQEFKVRPHYTLSPRHDSVIKQFTDIMTGLEDIFVKEQPSLVIVVGDVNSTLAGAMTAHKMKIRLAHVEAGLRSYNRQMPEEINRVITDRLSDILLASSDEAIENLRKESITENVHPVGNIMIDTLEMFLPEIKTSDELFYFCTLHRAENVDNRPVLNEIIQALAEIAHDATIYLPLHPRTKKMAQAYGLLSQLQSVTRILDPLNYRDSLYYQKNAHLVLTDSGGIQEETSYLGTPCITLRTETERPITVTQGTNTIGGVTKESILKAYRAKDLAKKKITIPYWDGKTAIRVVSIIKNLNCETL